MGDWFDQLDGFIQNNQQSPYIKLMSVGKQESNDNDVVSNSK